MHKPHICTSASGLLSKMINKTPSGLVTLLNSNPFAISVCSKSFPIGSSMLLSARNPSDKFLIFCADSFNRAIKFWSMSGELVAVSMSSLFADIIFDSFRSSEDAMFFKSWSRWAVVSDWSCREATRARLAWSVVDRADIARVVCVFFCGFEKEKKGKIVEESSATTTTT
jgi:hypothetical protein